MALLHHGVVAAIVGTLFAGTAIFAVQGALVGLIGANPVIVTIGAEASAALFMLPQFAGRQASAFNVYDALQLFSAYGLVALGVGLTMIVGEFDFGVLGVFALCPMIAVKLGETNLFLGLGTALALAALVGFLEGAIVAKLRVHSMPVTLGFYIALLGANIAIGNSQSVSFSNLDAGSALDAAQFYVFSWRSIIALLVFALVFVVMRFTRLGREIRAVGGDRRASRMVWGRGGPRADRRLRRVSYVLGAGRHPARLQLRHSAFESRALSAAVWVTAAIIGGVSLAGGVGGALGIAAGALTLSLLQELFSLLAAPTYLSSLVTH
jgi:ribose transport system permease protein